MLIEITDETFEEEVLKSNIPVLLDFSATWCGPCKKQLEVLEKFSIENDGKIKVCKIDADSNPTTIALFKVKSLPSILLFNNGSSVASKVGLINFNTLTQLVKDNA